MKLEKAMELIKEINDRGKVSDKKIILKTSSIPIDFVRCPTKFKLDDFTEIPCNIKRNRDN